MTPKSQNPPSLYGHHKRLAGPALTTKFSKLIDNRRPRHEFSQHDDEAGFSPLPTSGMAASTQPIFGRALIQANVLTLLRFNSQHARPK